MVFTIEPPISKEKAYTYDEAVTLLKIGKFHYLNLLICGMCLTAMMTELAGISFLMSAAKCDLEFSVTEQSLLGSSGSIGIVLGSPILGIIADLKGRRKTLLVSIGISICSSVISSFSVNTYMLITFRIINGLFISVAQSVVFTYVGEFHSDQKRSKYITLLACFYSLGALYSPSLAIGILPLSIAKFPSWRVFVILLTIPSWIGFVGLLFLPESPKFLLLSGKATRCLETLQKIYNLNNGDSENYPCKFIEPIAVVETKESSIGLKVWKQVKELFAKERLLQTLNFCLVMFSLAFTTFGIYMWLPTTVSFIIKDDSNSAGTICAIIKRSSSGNGAPVDCNGPMDTLQFQVLIGVGICFCVSFVFINQMITVIGKKLLFSEYPTVSKTYSALKQFLFNTVFWVSFVGAFAIGIIWMNNVYLIIASLTVIAAILNISGVLSAMATDYYPTSINSTALSLIMTFNKLGAAVGTMIVGPLMLSHCEGVFIGLGALAFITAVLVFLLPGSKKH